MSGKLNYRIILVFVQNAIDNVLPELHFPLQFVDGVYGYFLSSGHLQVPESRVVIHVGESGHEELQNKKTSK